MSKIEVNTVDAQCGSTITVGSSGKNVKIEGNDIRSNDYKASDGGNIINQSGTTITLGASGDTINLASGASQSGFGRSGSVNWQTTPKTATFTAADGEGYFINSGSSITANLPAGVAGAIVAFSDYARNFATYNLTITPNGSEKIGGTAASVKLNVDGQAATFVYVDSTKGWVNVQNAEDTEQGVSFITATGGTITCSGDFKIHTFTGPGTFCVSALSTSPTFNVADYLVVAGGGGGGRSDGNSANGGGGGGGFRSSNDTCMPSPQTSPLANATGLTLSVQPYSISVGGGGPGAGSSSQPAPGVQGSSSSFSTITSTGGGFGAGVDGPGSGTSGNGGSGGGAIRAQPAGTGNTPPVSPSQGNNGGLGVNGGPSFAGGGGGGAGSGGANGSPGAGGAGGVGSFMVSTGFAGCNGVTGPVSGARYFAGGGGGGSCHTASVPERAIGGIGGGGDGGLRCSRAGENGFTNTGGGGGAPSYGASNQGGIGGSGIVIIRYRAR